MGRKTVPTLAGCLKKGPLAWCMATLATIIMAYLGSDLGSRPPENVFFFLMLAMLWSLWVVLGLWGWVPRTL